MPEGSWRVSGLCTLDRTDDHGRTDVLFGRCCSFYGRRHALLCFCHWCDRNAVRDSSRSHALHGACARRGGRRAGGRRVRDFHAGQRPVLCASWRTASLGVRYYKTNGRHIRSEAERPRDKLADFAGHTIGGHACDETRSTVRQAKRRSLRLQADVATGPFWSVRRQLHPRNLGGGPRRARSRVREGDG